MAKYYGMCDMLTTWEIDTCTGVLIIKGNSETFIVDTDFLQKEWCQYANLIRKVVIEKGAVSITSWAFFKLEHLEEVIIPDSVLRINERAFSGCTSLKSIVIPNSVNIIDTEAFASCENLTSVIFADGPNSCTVKNFAFQNCSNLTDLKFPPGTLVYKTAFNGCPKLNII